VSPRVFSYLHDGKSVRQVLLEYLATRDYASVDDIVRDCHLRRHTVRYLLRDLEERGLVRRVYDGSKPYDVEVLPALRDAVLNISS